VRAQSPHVVEVRGLRKHFHGRGADGRKGAVAAVDGVDLQVRAGELVVLLGPSGCGKTTLLRCIAGLERPSAGEIKVRGDTVFSADTATFVPPEHRHIGMMFQSYALWPHMTVAENIAYPLSAVPRAERQARVAEMLDRLGVAGLGHRYPGELSGGQQQRVALARALVASQSLILFDEPLSNVDAKVRRRLRAELREVKQRNGFAGIYVTHDQEEAMELADTLVVMESGQIRQVAAPREVYRRPVSSYVAGFVGEINRWPAKVLAADGGSARFSSPLGELSANDADSARVGEQGWVGIRPEHVTLAASGVPAVVQDLVHLGARIECRLTVADSPLTASLSDEQAAGLAIGQPVHVHFPAEKLRWLPT
jgi:iron(III) transport system ATP-binding protein